jgi:hypothetical protein
MSRKRTHSAIQVFFVLWACDSGGFDPHRAPAAAPTPTRLAFTVQPTQAIAGAPISPMAVTVEDTAGNTMASASTSITVAMGTNPGRGTLSGTTTVAAVSGVATFSNLTIDEPGTYTLTADAAGLSGSISDPFNVINPVATVLVAPAQATVDAGSLLTLTATTLDAAGNVVSGRTVTWTTSDWRMVYLMSGSNSGEVCGVAGSATITATSEGKSGTALITVTGSIPSVACCYAGC